MLKSISIDGFKSFRGFSLDLRPGLNVVAGPNGSGKTNLIKFFEFLSHLARGPLVEAISRSGGAGSIFRQALSGGISPTISFSFAGESISRGRKKSDSITFAYNYTAKIEILPEDNLVLFTNQILDIEEVAGAAQRKKQTRTEPAGPNQLRIAWRFQDSGAAFDQLTVRGAAFRSRIFFGSNAAPAIEELIRETKDEFKNVSIFAFLRHLMEPIAIINTDVVSGRSYNINPDVVRSSEDIASEPGIKPDGGGLAATLYSAKLAVRHQRYEYQFGGAYYDWTARRRYSKNLLQDLIRYSKLVNSDIFEVDVESEPLENRLRVFLQIAYEGDRLRLPLSLVSDGTAKWLSLVAAVLTNPSIFAIEEPENFLHPYMQREIVNIVRSSCHKSSSPTFAILTTHSETLINCVRPEELVILSMVDGATRAIRPSNVEELRAEIQNTGFGLGYYYLAGAVE